MKVVFGISTGLFLFLTVACKKDHLKTVNVDQSITEFNYGELTVSNYLFFAENTVRVSFTSIDFQLFKSPGNELADYPLLKNTYSSIGKVNYDSTAGRLFCSSGSGYEYPTANFNLYFESPQLGVFNFAETDAFAPNYFIEKVDTFFIHRDTITTIYVDGHSQLVESVIIDDAKNQIRKGLWGGSNSVSIFPDEVKLLRSGVSLELRLEFSKHTIITVSGKRYGYNVRFQRSYPAKIIS